MRPLLTILALALLSGCAGMSGYYHERSASVDKRLTTVCRVGAHNFTVAATAGNCRLQGGAPL